MSIQTSYSKQLSDFKKELDEIKANILYTDVRQILRSEQSKGDFPKSKDDYDVFVTQKGRQSKRNLNTLNPKFFTIGTPAKPTIITFVTGGDWDEVAEAYDEAMALLRMYVPRRTGKLLNSIFSEFAGTNIATGNAIPQLAEQIKGQEYPSVIIALTTPYASTVEAGYTTGYYRKGRTGVVLRVATELHSMYANTISVRYLYVTGPGGVTVPAIEISKRGAFPWSAKKAGSRQRKKRSASRRRSRR